MRVLQAIAGSAHGGAELFFIRLAKALRRAGLEQRVLIRRDPIRAAALREDAIEPVELRFGGPLDFRSRRGFARAIAEFEPAVVLTWMSRASGFCPPAKPPGRFVHVGRLGGYYDLKYYRRCDHLIGITPDLVDYMLRKGWPAARAHYLPNFVHAEPAPAVARGALGTPEDAPLLLAMGRLHVNKGFDLLLTAMAALPGVWLWLAGSGPLDASLKQLADRLGVADRVRFLGWRDDLPGLAAAADAYVVPSRHEPFGSVLIEAWAHRLPLIAAASAGPAGLIRAGETGMLAPVEDAGALAAAIRQVLADRALAQRLVEAGWAAYRAGFTEEVVVGRYLEFLDRVARHA